MEVDIDYMDEIVKKMTRSQLETVLCIMAVKIQNSELVDEYDFVSGIKIALSQVE
jgi:hypothetical protein